MIYYFLALSNAYLLSLYGANVHIQKRWWRFSFLMLAASPLVFFAALRGASGKDTPMYILRYALFNFEWFWESLTIDAEPLFNGLIGISKYFSEDVTFFFSVHAVILCSLYTFLIMRWSQYRAFLLTVGPMFLVDGLTNGMRTSIAYFCVLLVASGRPGLILSIAAFLTHISSIIALVMHFFSNKLKTYASSFGKRLLLVISLSTLALAVSKFNNEDQIDHFAPRLAGKIDYYSDATLGTIYSGLADIFVFTIMGLALAWSHFGFKNAKFWQWFLLIALSSLTLYVSIQQSLAFIRVTKWLIVFLCMLFATDNAPRKVPVGALLTVGLLYTLNYLRQVGSDAGFLPYGT